MSDSELRLGAVVSASDVATLLVATRGLSDHLRDACGDPSIKDGALRILLMAAATDADQLVARALRLEGKSNLDVIEISALRAALSEARIEALTDPLTRLPNRRAFSAALDLAGERSQLLLIDIDHFKRVNDEYGHAAPDEVLCIVGGLVRANVRGDHFFARIGGDEFVLLLPDTSGDDAADVALRLCALVRGRTLWLRRHPATVEGMSLSIGITERVAGEDGSAWYDRADSALYRAKNHGRDCVARDWQIVRHASTVAKNGLLAAMRPSEHMASGGRE